MTQTPNRKITLVPENVLDPAAGINKALNEIDLKFVPIVLSMTTASPPSGTDGDVYVVPTGGTDAWLGLDYKLVRYNSEGAFWTSVPPEEVGLVLNREDNLLYGWAYDSSPAGWVAVAGLSDAPLDGQPYVRRNGVWELAYPEVVTVSGTSRTIAPSDAGTYMRFTNASAKTATFNDSQGYSAGEEYHIRNSNSNDLTLTEAGSMTLNPPAGGTLVVPEDGMVTVKVVASDEADVIGVTVPV